MLSITLRNNIDTLIQFLSNKGQQSLHLPKFKINLLDVKCFELLESLPMVRACC